MQTFFDSRFTRVVLICSALFLMSGCGATSQSKGTLGNSISNYGTSELSSRTPVTSGGIGQCNMFDSRSTTLTGRVTVYVDSAGVLQEDKVRMRITNLNSKFAEGTNMHIKMFRWNAEGTSPIDFDENPVSFTIESGITSGFALTDPMTSLTYNDILKIRSEKGVAGTTMMEFFANTTIAVQGVDYHWDALKIVVYDGANTVGQVDFLIPVFAASPTSYALDHAPVLQSLHPLWNERSKNLSDQDWQARTQSFCF